MQLTGIPWLDAILQILGAISAIATAVGHLAPAGSRLQTVALRIGVDLLGKK